MGRHRIGPGGKCADPVEGRLTAWAASLARVYPCGEPGPGSEGCGGSARERGRHDASREGGATLARAIGAGPRRADTLYAVYHGAFWLAPGIFFPFLYPLLARHGVALPQLGVVAAALPLCALVAQPAVGWLCDWTGRARGILGLLTLLSALVLPLFSAVRGFTAELGVAVAFSVVNAPLAPLGDALTVSYLGPRSQQHGRLRLWGSLAFALAGIGAGLTMGAGALGRAKRSCWPLCCGSRRRSCPCGSRWSSNSRGRGSGRRADRNGSLAPNPPLRLPEGATCANSSAPAPCCPSSDSRP